MESESIFDRGVYLGKNTYQAASVEFGHLRWPNYARGRLQKDCRKAPKGIFDSLSPGKDPGQEMVCGRNASEAVYG